MTLAGRNYNKKTTVRVSVITEKVTIQHKSLCFRKTTHPTEEQTCPHEDVNPAMYHIIAYFTL